MSREDEFRKESLSDAIAGAATVFAHALKSQSSAMSYPCLPTSALITTSALSHNNQANLRRNAWNTCTH